MSTVISTEKSSLVLEHEIHSVLLPRLLCTVSAARSERLWRPPPLTPLPTPPPHPQHYCDSAPTALNAAVQYTIPACDRSRRSTYCKEISKLVKSRSQGEDVCKQCLSFFFFSGNNFSDPAASHPTPSAGSTSTYYMHFPLSFIPDSSESSFVQLLIPRSPENSPLFTAPGNKKMLMFGFLLDLRLCWTFHVFGKTKSQGGLKVLALEFAIRAIKEVNKAIKHLRM